MKTLSPKKIRYIGIIILFLFSMALIFINVKNDYAISFANLDTFFTEEEVEGTTIARGDKWNVWSGNYSITMEYSSNTDIVLSITYNDLDLSTYTLPAAQGGSYTFDFNLPDKTDDLRINLLNNYNAITFDKISLSSDRPLYMDTVFNQILIFLCGCILLYFMTTPTFYKASWTQKLFWIILGCTVLYSLLPLFGRTLGAGYDMAFHLDRIEEIKNGLYERQFPVFIYPKNCNDFGLMGGLYPDLFIYIGAFFRALHMSLIGSYKLLVFMAQAAGMLIAYFSVKSICKSDYAASLSGILFLLFPYRLVNIYNRNALGETIAMIFFPLMIAALYHIACGNHKTGWKWLVAGYSGIFQSHILSCIFAVILTIAIIIPFSKSFFQKERIQSFCKAVLGTILVNLWYIVPFVTFYLDGFNSDVLIGDYLQEGGGSAFAQLFGFSNDWIMGQAGISGLLCLIILLLSFLPIKYLAKYHNPENMVINGSSFLCLIRCMAVLGLFFTFMSSSAFPWAILRESSVITAITDMLQFPYRFLTLTAVIITMAVPLLLFGHQLKPVVQYLISLVLFTAVIWDSSDFVIPTFPLSESGLTKVYGGINDIYWPEYWPKGANEACYRYPVLFYSSETFQFPRYEKNGTNILCQYTVSEDGNYIEFPLFYYIGYKATLTPEGSKKATVLPIERGSEYRIRVNVPKAETPAIIKIEYTGTWYFHVSMMISVVTLAAFLLYQVKRRKSTSDSSSSCSD